MSPEEKILHDFKQLCNARMAETGLNDREVALLSHIRCLQRTLELVAPFVPHAPRKLLSDNIELSKEIVAIALGINK